MELLKIYVCFSLIFKESYMRMPIEGTGGSIRGFWSMQRRLL